MFEVQFLLAIIKIGIDPVLVKLGPLALHWYGVMYVVGIVVALMVVLPFVAQRGIDRDTALEIFFPIVIGGLVGGRLYYVVQSNFGFYLSHPWKVLATWEGGMAFFGAIFGACIVMLYLARTRHLSAWALLDAGALFAPLGQAFGRIGNIVNGDILGYRSNCAWCVRYTNPNSFAPSHHVAYQPAAAYELLISLGIFALLWTLRFRPQRGGMLFGSYLVLYSLSQFGIFFARSEPIVVIGLKQAQITALVTLVVGVAIVVYTASRGPSLTAQPPNDGLYSESLSAPPPETPGVPQESVVPSDAI